MEGTRRADNQCGGDKRLIYYYACGTNLESEDSAITNEIHEMQNVKLPPNVKILIQTGTTSKWHHEIVNANGRYIYDSNGLRPDGAPFESNMFEPSTLTSFLKYAQEHEKTFKPAHRIFIFAAHGGIRGVCFDEPQKNCSDLNGIMQIFKDAQFTESQPFDLIVFDACEKSQDKRCDTRSNHVRQQ